MSQSRENAVAEVKKANLERTDAHEAVQVAILNLSEAENRKRNAELRLTEAERCLLEILAEESQEGK